MKHLTILLSALMFLLSAEIALAGSFSGWSNPDRVVRYKTTNNTYDYQMTPSNSYCIGREDGTNGINSGSPEDTYRCQFGITVSEIPAGSTITNATLTFNVAYQNLKTFKVTQLSSNLSWGPLWNGIASGTLIADNVSYSATSISNSTLISVVQTVVNNQQGVVRFGFLSKDEANNHTYGNVATLTLNVTYTPPAPTTASITVQNNFLGGWVLAGEANPPPQIAAGTPISKIVGTTLYLQASLPQNDPQNYPLVWNDYASQSTSKWQKSLGGSTFDVTNSNSYSFTLASTDNGAVFTDYLRRNYAISRIDQTEFDETIPAGVVTNIVEQNSGTVPAPLQQSIGAKSYQFGGWTDVVASNNRSYSPTDNTTLTARYKYPHHSDRSTALANTSQRKIVRTLMGTLYMVYESMNHVWLERSTDEGATWTLCNNGPIDTGLEAKSPSIDFLNSLDYDTEPEEIYITYQQKLAGGNYSIELAQYGGYGVRQRLHTSPSAYSSSDATPVLSINWYLPVYNQPWRKQIVGIWKEPANAGVTAGLYWYAGYYEYEDPTFHWNSAMQYERINYSDATSANPAIDVYKYDYTARLISYNFHLAWEQNGQQIYYQKISCSYIGLSLISTPNTPSYGDGFNYNTRPSIAALANDQARMCWLGVYDDGCDYYSQAVFADPASSDLGWTLGWRASSTSINSNYDDVYQSASYAVAWTENYYGSYSSYALKYPTLSEPFNLNTSGKDLQLYNGWSWDTQKGLSLSTSSPYAFQVSSPVDPNGGLQKTVPTKIFAGRMGVISFGNAQFHFTLGNIAVDGQNIDFVPFTDTTHIKTSDDYKPYLVSKPFNLSDNSQFLYDVQYGVIDSVAAVAALSEGQTVEFKVELVDGRTNQVIGTYDDVRFTAGHITRYSNIGYDVETKGSGTKTVMLRLVASTSLPAHFRLFDKRAHSRGALGKAADERVKKTINGITLVTEYALTQNYPNPFNPSTTISYAIPQSGMVTVKVYDMLGKKIATLVNEYKSQGRYAVSFNAGHLSSGMYICKIQAGTYSATKKMQLLK